MLILFDIDATLIRTEGAGIKAMVDAGSELFGPGFTAEGVAFAGRLDPLILADLLMTNRQTPNPGNIQSMRRAYRKHLEVRLKSGVGRALPGVAPLLDRLQSEAAATLGLLTGNFAETGSAKLAACGIQVSRFAIQVWGDDSPHDPPAREHLPAVGMQRYRQLHRRDIAPQCVVIIGDTPHDISCAKAHGCRSLGVGTGQFRAEQLLASGADHAVDDLSNTEAVMDLLGH